MGDFSDPESSHNLLEKDTATTNTSTSSTSNGSKPSSHHNHHHYANTATTSNPANGDPATSQQKPDAGGGMANKSYTSANASGAGGPSVALNYSADNGRLQRKVARLTSYLYGLTIVVIVGGVILIATVASLYGKLYYDLKHHAHQPKVGEQISKILEREELCVPCSEVRLGPSPEEEAMLNVFTKRDSREGQKCCVERPAELLRLLELYINKTYRQEIAKGNIKIRQSISSDAEDKPAAHLMGYPQRQDQNQAPGRQFPISSWIYREDLAFINLVTYRYGRIVVPEDGLYYVYSQVAFLEVLSPSGSSAASSSSGAYGTESPSLSHYLYRYNIIYPNGGEEKLVQNSITKCWGPNKAFGEYTSYLGAVFHLRQGDEVFVKVSNLTMMALDPKSNYFGLFKL